MPEACDPFLLGVKRDVEKFFADLIGKWSLPRRDLALAAVASAPVVGSDGVEVRLSVSVVGVMEVAEADPVVEGPEAEGV